MNAHTGQIHDLPEHLFASPGEVIPPAAIGSLTQLEGALQDAERRSDDSEESERLGVERARSRTLREALERGEPIVAVDAEVVQKLRLGERELRRRRQRR